ncbi:MAG: HAD family phosphatase [Clostridia bacterium]|nr:HAD family phosphatase [Clostridia bacterium]
MKFDGIILISDMDGTLLTEEKTISRENLDAIRYFRENGGKFTVASGRVYQSLESYFDEIAPDLPVISHNGGIIKNPMTNELLYAKLLSGNYKEVIKEIHKKFPWLGIEGFTPDEILFFTDNPYVRKHINDEKIFPDNRIEWHSLEEETPQWCKILMAAETDEVDMLETTIPPLYPQYSFVRSEAHYFELLPHGVHKGSALTELLKLLNISPDKCYAVGDNMNDKEMLEAAGCGIAVKNANRGLKEMADVVLPVTCEEHAIKAVIELLDKGTI